MSLRLAVKILGNPATPATTADFLSPYEAIHTLFLLADSLRATGAEAFPAQAAMQSTFDATHAELMEAAQIWLCQLANDVGVSLPGVTHDFASKLQHSLQAAQTALTTLGSTMERPQRLRPMMTALTDIAAAASHYNRHHNEMVAGLKADPESKARLYAYFGDQLGNAQ